MSRVPRIQLAWAPFRGLKAAVEISEQMQKSDQFAPPLPPTPLYRLRSDFQPDGDSPCRPNGDCPRGGIGRLQHRIGSLPSGRYQPEVTQICQNPCKPCNCCNRLIRPTGTVPANESDVVNPDGVGSHTVGSNRQARLGAGAAVRSLKFATWPRHSVAAVFRFPTSRGQSPQAQRGLSPQRDRAAAAPDWLLADRPLTA